MSGHKAKVDEKEVKGNVSEPPDGTGKDGDTGFAIGTIVFPMDPKQKDFVDTGAVFINDADTYVGSYLGKILSEQQVGITNRKNEVAEVDEDEEGDEDDDEEVEKESEEKPFWKILGTVNEKTKIVPSFLWAVMRNEGYEGYLKEVLKCGVIIYDITHDQSPQRLNEIRAICEILRTKWPTFRTKRIFILISSLHSWSNTTSSSENLLLSEDNYRFRRTHPQYRELQLLERLVVASGKMTKGMVKAYVVGAGIPYGGAEEAFHHWFKSAWHNVKNLPVYGDGMNRMPTIHIRDLTAIIQHVMDITPKNQRYIIAVDPVIPRQIQVAKAISNVLGNGKLKHVSHNDIYLNRELTSFQGDQILLDLNIESKFVKETFPDFEWTATEGFPSIIKKLVDEFRSERHLTPLKLIILGPPAVGKSTVARQISDLYHIHHFTIEELLVSTIEILKEAVVEEMDPGIEGFDPAIEEGNRERSTSLLNEIDAAKLDSGTYSTDLPPELIVKIVRYRLLSHACQNQGYILDGYPLTYDESKLLFIADDNDDEEYRLEEDGEDSGDVLDIRLAPDRIIILEAPEEFLKERLSQLPITSLLERHYEENYDALLANYNEKTIYEKSSIAYFDEQEIPYVIMDVTTDQSPLMKQIVTMISMLLGKPQNYGLQKEEEEALLDAQKSELAEKERQEQEDAAILQSRELEERRRNIQKWMENLAKVKKEEFEREEIAMVPLRNYLMAHIVPTLTRGLMDVTRARPEDPIDYLAEFLFQNNPGGISQVNPSMIKQT